MFASVLTETFGMEEPGTVHPPMNTFFNYNKLMVQPDPEDLVMRQRRALEQPITFMDSMDSALKPFTDVQSGQEGQDALRQQALTIPPQFLESGQLPKDMQDYVKYLQDHPDRPVSEMKAPVYKGVPMVNGEPADQWKSEHPGQTVPPPAGYTGWPDYEISKQTELMKWENDAVKNGTFTKEAYAAKNAELQDQLKGAQEGRTVNPEVDKWWSVITEIGKVGWNNLTPEQLQQFSATLGATQASVGSASSNWFYNNAAFRPLIAPSEQGRMMAQFSDQRSQQAIAAAKSSPLNWQNWTAALGTGIAGAGMIRGIRGGMGRGLGGGMPQATDLGGGGGYAQVPGADGAAVPAGFGGDNADIGPPAAKRQRLAPDVEQALVGADDASVTTSGTGLKYTPEELAARTAAGAHLAPVLGDERIQHGDPAVQEISGAGSAMGAVSAMRAVEMAPLERARPRTEVVPPPKGKDVVPANETTPLLSRTEQAEARGTAAVRSWSAPSPKKGLLAQFGDYVGGQWRQAKASLAQTGKSTANLLMGRGASRLGTRLDQAGIFGTNDPTEPLLFAQREERAALQTGDATGIPAAGVTAAPESRTTATSAPVVGAPPSAGGRTTVPTAAIEMTVPSAPDAAPSGMSTSTTSHDVEVLGSRAPSLLQQVRNTLALPGNMFEEALWDRLNAIKQEYVPEGELRHGPGVRIREPDRPWLRRAPDLPQWEGVRPTRPLPPGHHANTTTESPGEIDWSQRQLIDLRRAAQTSHASMLLA